jgi:hypothetical protein
MAAILPVAAILSRGGQFANMLSRSWLKGMILEQSPVEYIAMTKTMLCTLSQKYF